MVNLEIWKLFAAFLPVRFGKKDVEDLLCAHMKYSVCVCVTELIVGQWSSPDRPPHS